jgi:hypothetical protein
MDKSKKLINAARELHFKLGQGCSFIVEEYGHKEILSGTHGSLNNHGAIYGYFYKEVKI